MADEVKDFLIDIDIDDGGVGDLIKPLKFLESAFKGAALGVGVFQSLAKGAMGFADAIAQAELRQEAISSQIQGEPGKDLGGLGMERGAGLAGRMEQLRNLPNQFIEQLAASGAGAKLTAAIDPILRLFDPAGPIGQAIGGGLAKIVDVGAKALGMLPAVFESIGPVIGGVINVGESLWNILKALVPLVGPILSGSFSLLSGATSAASVIVGGVAIALEALEPLLSLVGRTVQTVTLGWGLLLGSLKDVVNFLQDAMYKAIESVAGALSTIFDPVFSGISEAVDEMKAFAGRFWEIGQEMVSGFINGITESIANAKQAIIDLGSGVMSTLKGMLGIASPSRVFMDYGRMTALGFEAGLDGEMANIERTMQRTFEDPSVEVGSTLRDNTDDWSISSPSLSAAGSGVVPRGGGVFGGATVNVDLDVNVSEPGSTSEEIAERIRQILPGSIQSALERMAVGAPA